VIHQWPGTNARPEIAPLLDASRLHLDDEAAQRIRERLWCELDWDYLLHMARRNRVTALLHRHLKAVDIGLVPQHVLDQLQGWTSENRLRNLSLTSELFKVLDLLDAHGISAIPYKGPTPTALAYGNPAGRKTGRTMERIGTLLSRTTPQIISPFSCFKKGRPSSLAVAAGGIIEIASNKKRRPVFAI
jgi:hypothetical protein